ncbi:MAG: hypothetical protein M0D55_19870 [Elusimicrobiota bacterium]|nr:MAG: hypothetical protein M0D55_19870 [Elusimicrobiota bacterium]
MIFAACSRKPAQNYRKCLKLRIGMTAPEILAAMGEPDESFPYVEGKSLPHLKGRTAHEWSTPASMPAPVRVSIDDATGKAESIRCADVVVTAAVFVEPPEPAVSTAAVAAQLSALSSPPSASTAPAAGAAAPARRGLRERSSSSAQSSGRPLTE